MTRTRTVYPSSQVIHLWANRHPTDTRNPGGTVFTSGRDLFSYGHHFILGRHLRTVKTLIMPDAPPEAQLNAWVERLALLSSKYGRARTDSSRDVYSTQMRRIRADVAVYCSWADLETPDFSDAIRAHRELTERQQAKKRADELAHREHVRATLHAWRKREPLPELREGWKLNMRLVDHGAALRLSLDGSEVETSMGASIPTDHARRIFGFIALIRERGAEWSNPGTSQLFNLGHFRLDHVDAIGNIKAGCHRIDWQEIEALAQAISAPYVCAEPLMGAVALAD